MSPTLDVFRCLLVSVGTGQSVLRLDYFEFIYFAFVVEIPTFSEGLMPLWDIYRLVPLREFVFVCGLPED